VSSLISSRRLQYRRVRPGLWLLVLVALSPLLLSAPARAQKDLTVKLPAAGEYLVWLEAHTASGTQAQAPVPASGDRAALSLPAGPGGLREWLVLALDQKSGYVAAKTLPAKNTPTSVSFSTTDFNRVHRVRVQVTGAGEKPIANASVTLTDVSGLSLSKVIDPTSAGMAEFTDVPSGNAKLVVTPGGGKSTSKDVDINLPKGETVQNLTVPLPEITAVVEPPAAATPGGTPSSTSPSGSEEATGTDAKSAGDEGTDATDKAAPSESPAAPVSPPEPAPRGGSGLGTFVGLILIGGVGYWLYLRARDQGWTLDKALARLGVQPVEPASVAAGAGSTPAPPPPPVDPSICAFCGQRKDPVTGACACSLDASPAGLASAPPSSSGSGPRLVAVGGLAMGQIFPLAGDATIGRDAGNSIALAMDSTVSRSHAVISPEDGGFVIRDQGSSNGTFVNGARVTESPLSPGDEVSIGGTRFRFEA
jgi:hypothetical protein